MDGIPFTLCCLCLGEQGDDVKPRQLGSRLLPKLTSRAVLCKISHVFEISSRETLHVRKGGFEVGGSPGDNLTAPAEARLAVEDITADAMVELDQLRIDREYCAAAGGMDAAFYRFQPGSVVGRNKFRGHSRGTQLKSEE